MINLKVRYICISLFFISSLINQAKTYATCGQTPYDNITDFEIVKVRDGDTFVINVKNIPDVFGEEIAVRIRGIDTPELNDEREDIRKISIQAKEELERLLYSGKKVILYDLGRDKYFRLLASVKVGDIDIAEYMTLTVGRRLERGLAKEYDGGKKVW